MDRCTSGAREKSVQDRSHKLFFLTATAFMCAASIYGSQAGPTMLLSEDGPNFRSAELVPAGMPPLAQLAIFTMSGPEDTPREGNSAPQGTATIIPNATSCPVDGRALVSPPSVNSAIGSRTPIEKTLSPSQALSDAAIGTGSSCPSPRLDAGKAENLTPRGILSASPPRANTLSGPVISH